MKFKVGLVGFGYIGYHHYNAILKLSSNFTLTTIFEKNLLLKKGNIEKIHFWENSHKHEKDCIRSSFNRELYLVYLNAIS